jgi:hypothetical protein
MVKACGRIVTVLDAFPYAALTNLQAKIAGKPLYPFHFSSNSAQRAPIANVIVSPDRLTAKRSSLDSPVFAWACSEQGVGAGCGAVRWAIKLSEESGRFVHTLGVASDTCREFTEPHTLNSHPKQVWFFQNDRKSANGHCGDIWSGCFDAGDVVVVELEQAPARPRRRAARADCG